jgi:hypothetical protein
VKLNTGFLHCPICTTPNPPGATVCRGCGNPLGTGVVPDPAQAKPVQWGLYVAIAAAALLAVVLIIVLIQK